MSEPLLLILIVVQGTLTGALCSYVASQKQRSTLSWFFLGLFLSILALIALVAIPPLGEKARSREACKLFDGERNLADSRYHLYLTQTFNIEKNSTLEKFVVSGNIFDTLSDALDAADEMYDELLESIRKNREAREITATKKRRNYIRGGAMIGALLVALYLYRISAPSSIGHPVYSPQSDPLDQKTLCLSKTPLPLTDSTPLSSLRIEFNGKSWIEVRDGSRCLVFSGEFSAGQHQDISVNAPFTLWVGTASAVSIFYGGRPIDLSGHTHEGVARLTVE